MGEVWRAWDQQGQRWVAAKLLHPHLSQDVNVVGRFIQERSILMGLRHPNIVEVLDLVVEGSNLAIVMPFIGGGSLGAYRAAVGTFPAAVAVSAVSGVLAATAYAHEQGVLHRDIKPDNVLLDGTGTSSWEEAVRLSDFGIARLAQEETVRMTGLLGTPAYMAPEIFESGVFSQASDVYSIGIMLYELLAGRTPFEGGLSPIAVGMRHVYSQLPRLPVDERLWQVIATMLAKDPRNRLTAQDTLSEMRELPEDALSAGALPVQSQPAAWDSLPERSPVGSTLHMQQMTGDIGQTYVPTDPDEAAPLAVPGIVKAIVSAEPGDTGGETIIAADQERVVDPVLTPQVEAVAPRRRRRWVIIPIAVVVVALVVAAIWLPKALASRHQEAAIVYVAGHAVGTQLPSGLRIDYEADAGQDPGTVALSVMVSADKVSGLDGDVLLAFSTDSTQCPTVVSTAWVEPVTQLQKSADGIDTPCGYRIPVTLSAGQTQSVGFVLSGISSPDLGSWITGVQSATSQVLSTVTGDGFALQRITGVQVTAQSVQLSKGSANVPFQVVPVWQSSTATASAAAVADPLFTDATLDYQSTDLLLSLTGGEGFAKVSVTSCSATQVVGHRVVAEQSASSCQVQVTVGALDPAQGSFSIRMAPS